MKEKFYHLQVEYSNGEKETIEKSNNLNELHEYGINRISMGGIVRIVLLGHYGQEEIVSLVVTDEYIQKALEKANLCKPDANGKLSTY